MTASYADCYSTQPTASKARCRRPPAAPCRPACLPPVTSPSKLRASLLVCAFEWTFSLCNLSTLLLWTHPTAWTRLFTLLLWTQPQLCRERGIPGSIVCPFGDTRYHSKNSQSHIGRCISERTNDREIFPRSPFEWYLYILHTTVGLLTLCPWDGSITGFSGLQTWVNT